MTLDVPHPAVNDEAKATGLQAPACPQYLGTRGQQQWLAWLQTLLSANALILYRWQPKSTTAVLIPLQCYPENTPDPHRFATLARRCAESRSVVRFQSDTNAQQSITCIPDTACRQQKGIMNILVVERATPAKLDAQTQVRLVAWAYRALHRFSPPGRNVSSDSALSLWSLKELESNAESAVAYASLMEKLATQTGSERCLLARLRLKKSVVSRVDLTAMSGQPRIDRRLCAASALVSNIDLAYRGEMLPLLPKHELKAEPSVADQTSIADMDRTCTRLLVPVQCAEAWFVVLLERSVNKPFSEAEQLRLNNELHAAMIVTHLSDPRTLSIRSAGKRQLRHWKRSLLESFPRSVLSATAAAAFLGLIFYPAEYRVSAPLNVEATERHVLIAPADGFVQSVLVKAGDKVSKGQTLATLNDRDLKLQRQQRQSEALQNGQAYSKALAAHDRVEVTRLKEEATLIIAELAQLEMQENRMTLKAPVDGVVLSGSWDDYLGAAVAGGDTLFTLGSTGSPRLVLDVPEYDVRRIGLGQSIGIRLSADPSRVLTASVTAVMPLAQVKDGVNSVQVHAALETSLALRPGMQGIGKIRTGRQPRVLQWVGRAGARLVWLGWKLGVLA